GDWGFVFTGGTDMDNCFPRLTLRERVIREGANLIIHAARRNRIIRPLRFGHVTRHLTALGLPFVTAAVENFYLGVPKKAECPERVAGPPVGFVAVENAGGVRSDSVSTAKLGKFFRCDVITDHRVLKISAPINVH